MKKFISFFSDPSYEDYGESHSNMYFINVYYCSGSQFKLLDCDYTIQKNYGGYQDWGVNCQPGIYINIAVDTL